MPELPEVETVRRGIEPHLLRHRIVAVHIRQPSLRQTVPVDLGRRLEGKQINGLRRRGKYLLMAFDDGNLLLHLGMSGSLRIVQADSPPGKHDHIDLVLDNHCCLRFTDPRRFGLVLWVGGSPELHPLLRNIGPEPLGEDFDGDRLHACSRNRKQAVKPFIMDSRVVAGVGNIYANESLFLAGIHPTRAAARISLQRYRHLADAVCMVLARAIEMGGTTLRDFTDAEGRPGYFRIELAVYGRAGQPCVNCDTALRGISLGQRQTVYCPRCQH